MAISEAWLRKYAARGGDLNRVNFSGDTLLHRALKQGCEECVQSLLENGADPNIKNALGFTAPKLAEYLGRKLLAPSIPRLNVSLLEKDGKKALIRSAAHFQKHLQIQYLSHLQFSTVRALRICHRDTKRMIEAGLPHENNWLGALHRQEIGRAIPSPFEIRWVDDKVGRGLFSINEIRPGRFIGEYTGIVRWKNALFARTNPYCFAYPMGKTSYTIDASAYGNHTRFINHSEKPNLQSISIAADGLMHIVLLTTRRVAPGEELLLNYGDRYW